MLSKTFFYIYTYIFLTNTLQHIFNKYNTTATAIRRLLIMIVTVRLRNILHIRCIDYNIPTPFLYLLQLI